MIWLWLYLAGVAATFFLIVVAYVVSKDQPGPEALVLAAIWPVFYLLWAAKLTGDYIRKAGGLDT